MRILIILISILQLACVFIYALNIQLDIKFRFDGTQTNYVQDSGMRIMTFTDIFCSVIIVFSIILLFVGIFYKTKTNNGK